MNRAQSIVANFSALTTAYELIKQRCSLYLPCFLVSYQERFSNLSQLLLLLRPWWTGNKVQSSLTD